LTDWKIKYMVIWWRIWRRKRICRKVLQSNEKYQHDLTQPWLDGLIENKWRRKIWCIHNNQIKR